MGATVIRSSHVSLPKVEPQLIVSFTLPLDSGHDVQSLTNISLGFHSARTDWLTVICGHVFQPHSVDSSSSDYAYSITHVMGSADTERLSA